MKQDTKDVLNKLAEEIAELRRDVEKLSKKPSFCTCTCNHTYWWQQPGTVTSSPTTWTSF